MFAPAGRASFLHGEQVAVATLTMARLQEDLLAGGPPRLRACAVTRDALQRLFGADAGESCWREFERKRLSEDGAAQLTGRVADVWDETVRALRAVTLPALRLAAILQRVGGPATPTDIGVTPAFYAAAVRNARYLRNRYTFLDLAGDSGHFERMGPGA
jgi:glycerol-1-phosphate dehydrogenase [NAD(P)+]